MFVYTCPFEYLKTIFIFSLLVFICSYAGLGKTAGILTLEAKEGTIQPTSVAVSNVGDFLAMHIVASRPLFLSKELVTQEVWDRERNIILSQVTFVWWSHKALNLLGSI